MDIRWILINKCRSFFNKLFSDFRLNRIFKGRESFTIISNTCWAGHVYRYFGLPYNTPTIGCGFFADDYIRFLSDIRKYLEMDLVMIPVEESKHFEEIKKQPKKFQTCPYGRLGDVEVRFAHYKTSEEALANWNKRKKRVNYDHLIIKFSEHLGCKEEHIRAFDALPYKDKFVFTAHDYGIESQVLFKEFMPSGDVLDDTLHFDKHINLINLINGNPFKR